MSIGTSPVQEKAANDWTSGASITVTATAPTNGNGLVFVFSSSTTTQGVSSISQTGATWVSAIVGSTGRRSEIWYALNVSGAGTTITVNLNYTPTTAISQGGWLTEWSGLATSSALDATASNNGVSTTPSAGSITPTASRNILIVSGARIGGNYSSGPTNSFTRMATIPNDLRTDGAWLVVSSSSGSYSTAWTAASGAWNATIATFLAPVAAGSVFGRTALDGLSIAGPKQFTRVA